MKNSVLPPKLVSNESDVSNSAPNGVLPVLQCSHCRRAAKQAWKVLLLLLFSSVRFLACSNSSSSFSYRKEQVTEKGSQFMKMRALSAVCFFPFSTFYMQHRLHSLITERNKLN